MEQERRFTLLTIRPHWAMYVIKQGFTFLAGLALLLVAGHDAVSFKMPLVALGAFILLISLYGCLSLYNLRFTVSSELLIIEHGVFHRSSDYIELYRVVDFSENRTFVEQLYGLKTVSIYSGDRTSPKLDIFGVKESLDLVDIIRERVEYNKRRKGVYEITNR